MPILDADRTLAAEIGLFLVQRAKTPGTAPEGPEAFAETWIVRNVLTRRAIGRLHFTAAGCLLAVKTTTGDQLIEETVADAIRWLSPRVRHARTGQYAGTEVIIRRFSSTFERPRALTACGATATAADFDPIAAMSALINGQPHEMCQKCRAQLVARDAQNLEQLPARRRTASLRQRGYIKRLLDEGARNGRRCLIDPSAIDKMSSEAASETIDILKALRARDWRGTL